MKNRNVKNLDLQYLNIYINPLCPIFGYVVCYDMTSSYAKNCTKLCCKSFYKNVFPFLQNLHK
jgi:hypothetical protein